jgi:spore coat polysaccharide biosynthesis protein SpsF (cytidylyltransferase family)
MTKENDTGFAYFFTKTDMFKQAEITPLLTDHVHDTARLTLDYDVDYQFFTAVIEALYMPDRLFTLSDVVKLLNAHPEILAINAGLEEEYANRTIEKAVLDYLDTDGNQQRIELS